MGRCLVLYVLAVFACPCIAGGDELGPGTPVALTGDVIEPEQLSGVTRYGGLLVVCPDEGCKFNVFEAEDPTHFRAIRNVSLADGNDEGENEEIDLEGAASDGNYLYLIGSHSLARRKIHPDESYKYNRSQMYRIKDDSSRDQLFRLQLGDHGKLKSKEVISLRKILIHDDLLGPFTAIPSKENGIDIEGIAVRDNELYLGFRGPVLRGNYVPVMNLKFDEPKDYRLLFVDLAGQGIRDLAATQQGFLIIAGPVGDAEEPFGLFYWNGKDCIPGANARDGKCTLLGNIPHERDTKPEGVAVLAEDDHDFKVLIVFDGAEQGQRFVVNKP